MTAFFSENPEKDLWRELLQFTYDANVERYLAKKGMNADEHTINSITGSFLQANEYYKAAKNTNLQISPLLLYYGSSNLLYGMTNLLNGNIAEINNHGMKVFIPDQFSSMSDVIIRFLSPSNGGVHVIAKALGFVSDLTGFGDWRLKDFLGSIAEISTDFERCYNTQDSCIVTLDVFNTPDGKVEKIYYNESNKNELLSLLSRVEGFDKSYLKLTTAKDFNTNREYFVLRHKLMGENISIDSYSGQPYLQAGHIKNSQLVTIPSILNMYISLFALASLCRYHPEQWSPFVLKDTTGEKLLIEKFLFYTRRLLPNFVLNKLLDCSVTYSSSRYSATDTIKLVGEHQVKEIIDQTLKKEMEKCQFQINMNDKTNSY